MTSILRADQEQAALVATIAQKSFIESHGASAPPADIDAYLAKNYSVDAFIKELKEVKNIYHIILYNGVAAGYSKIILDSPYAGSPVKNITKLERIYLLKDFYGLRLGQELFQFNADLARQNNQNGIWLYVWKGNPRAIDFYLRFGFHIIGNYDFPISPTHSNANYQMLLKL